MWSVQPYLGPNTSEMTNIANLNKYYQKSGNSNIANIGRSCLRNKVVHQQYSILAQGDPPDAN